MLSRLRAVDRVAIVIYTDLDFAAERGIPYLDRWSEGLGTLGGRVLKQKWVSRTPHETFIRQTKGDRSCPIRTMC